MRQSKKKIKGINQTVSNRYSQLFYSLKIHLQIKLKIFCNIKLYFDLYFYCTENNDTIKYNINITTFNSQDIRFILIGNVRR